MRAAVTVNYGYSVRQRQRRNLAPAPTLSPVLTSIPRFAMRLPFVAVSTLLLSPLLAAAPLSPATRAEIEYLLSSLQTSACEFNRNDSWHTASEAKTHLLKKLDYLEGKGLVQTTEQFIELGASKSSISGQPYLVKCGTTAVVDSKSWLSAQLKAIRASGRGLAAGSK